MNAPAPADQVCVSAPPASVRPAARPNRLTATLPAAAPQTALAEFAAVPLAAWRSLHARAIEPNAYYDPLWTIPVARHARGFGGAQALTAVDPRDPERLIGLMPVRSARQALSLPVPMLVGWNGYAPLAIPTLDRDCPVQAAGALLDAARGTGARALFLPSVAIDGEAFAAIRQALSERGLAFDVLRQFRRAALDATQDADTALRAALGSKKFKELRRQRHRLEDAGPITVEIASSPDAVAAALERFLALEQSGWKGRRGTGLGQHAGDTAFIREGAAALAADGRFEIISLVRGGAAIASGLVLRDRDRAYFLKIAMDENEARGSPGVQLTLEFTRHLCADPRIRLADSSADTENPMIDHVWRGRIEIADVFIALRPGDPIAAAIKALLRARYAAIECVRTLRRIREKLS